MALLAIVVMSSFALMEKGIKSRSIEELWPKYQKAKDMDRIQDMIDILGVIKSKAAQERATFHYFRACDEYVNAKSRQNWKHTEGLISSTSKELHEYGNPMLEILFGLRHGINTVQLLEKINQSAESMKKSENRRIYDFYPCSEFMFVRQSLTNDYEYIMWTLIGSRGYYEGRAFDAFVEYLDGKYPLVPYLQWMKLRYLADLDDRKEGLEKLAREYVGRGIGIAAEDELLQMRFNDMDDSSSEEYKALEKELINLESRKKTLKRGEAEVAEIYNSSSELIKTLRRKEASVRIKDGDAKILVRNMDKVKIVVLDGKSAVFETVAFNDAKSFYKIDTLDIELPALDDGKYEAVVYDGSKEIAHYGYEKFTISIARRQAADGMCIYAADYLTGKPVEKADLLLYDVKGCLISEYKDFIFDGFTPLPKKVYPLKDGKAYRLVCRYGQDGHIRSSKPEYISNEQLPAVSSETVFCSRVAKDRAAFVPGDTVKFKVFMYELRPDGSRTTLKKGEKIFVEVLDPERNVVSKMTLVTNEFGSATGSYAIADEGMNGSWSIWVRNKDFSVEPSYFTVDDFVLPSYDLSFNNPDELYFPGDEAKVSGKVMSYSGHGLTGLVTKAYIYVNHELVGEKDVDLSPDGSFEVSLKVGDSDDYYVQYGVEVRLTDETGETLEFNWNSSAVKEINLSVNLENGDDGVGLDGILSAVTAEIKAEVMSRGYEVSGIHIEYELSYGGKAVRSGSSLSGEIFRIDMSGLEPGAYKLDVKAVETTSAGGVISESEVMDILYLPKDETVMPVGTGRLFRPSYEDGNIKVQLGSGDGPVWAVVELFADDYSPLKKEMIHVGGTAGEPGSLVTLEIPYLASYSDNVSLYVFYFRDGRQFRYHESFSRPKMNSLLPLEFESFIDKTLPGQEVSLKLKTLPETEVLVSVFDASSQKIALNGWAGLQFSDRIRPIHISYSCSIGCDETDRYGIMMGYGGGRKSLSVGRPLMSRSAVSFDMAEENDAYVEESVAEAAMNFKNAEVPVRDDFATTLAFEPFLRPSADGTVEMRFRTSDKLSTFIVKAIAHDRSMNTAFAEKEMVVTLPVRVSVVPPKYLYEGDRYVLNASVSNTSAAPLRGKVYLEIYNGEEYLDVQPLAVREAEVDVPAGGSAAVGFEVTVPENVDSLGFKVVFVVHDVLISDGMFVPVPVYPAAQVLTESHSAVLLEGRSADELVARLRDEFVNVSSVGAEYSEISILDMMREALPVAYEPEERDAVSLSAAMYVNFMAASLRKGDDVEVRKCVEAAMNSVSRLLECANSDGGFAWFEGMPSSPIVTAVVLERYAGLSDRRLLDVAQTVWGEDSLDDLDAAMLEAVKYLDASYFGDPERPIWYGRLSLGQYLNLRSMFTGIPLDEAAVRKTVGKKKYNDFRKAVREYLIPKMTMTEGNVLEKVRAIRIINALMDASREGFHMARALGLSSNSDIKKMVRRRDNELISLKQYAVEHPSGGVYYPNAVMPWRGLLESEVYAHAQICNLFRDIADENYGDMALEDIADRICIWLMIQKETQGWASDPGYVEALAAVYDASEAVRNTKIVVLKKKFEKPFDEIKASGNGFTVDVDYYKEGQEGGRIRLAEGDSLNVGDKITAVYSLWSQENRSHVRLSVPRAACLRPVAQLSGWSGGWFRPLSYGHLHVSPYSYREVKADRTLYWIDVFPEEKTAIEEELFVTQEGTFSAPVAEIECLYAPHYRANDSWSSLLEISK